MNTPLQFDCCFPISCQHDCVIPIWCLIMGRLLVCTSTSNCVALVKRWTRCIDGNGIWDGSEWRSRSLASWSVLAPDVIASEHTFVSVSGQSSTLVYLYHDNYLNVFWKEKGVDLIKIHAYQPDKYALALCDALFEDSELAESCYKSTRRSTKPPLDPKGLHS